ncbi:TetR family transcriptional regulator [Streptomyces sp. ALI-76-A]|uniref:TetR/AcrR family transcriptional regulator n=1 Tax=Streptomyces sp. ALI-76-A TaxID=3025736 RepID=UPI00256EEA15|nr:TetR family transcriptional regulator [Streptomyces sp. ALI-76-A]MDL5202128.1 TetR family transcriptional regulator [Streptomyces sp. ALI-76-A]
MERRKAETRMEIARAAARLFVQHGLRATRAEDIAQAAGVAPRTFYRYFATKEEAVTPLYAAGADLWAEAVRTAPPGLPVPQALEHAVRRTLVPGADVSTASWEWVRTLIRLTETSPALRKVWAEVCHTGERTLAEVLTARRRLTLSDDNVAERPPVAVSSELRFAAAVASAAVRTAVEAWVASDAPAVGPGGPAELALRNLAAVGEFPWGRADAG